MAVLQEHFYHGTTRKYTAIFGTIFNDVRIVREDNGKEILVPLSFVDQQKHNNRPKDRPDIEEIGYKIKLPRMSFRLLGFELDDSRKTNKNNRLTGNAKFNPNIDLTKTQQYNRVPYNFSYELNIKTKYMDDMLQIFEQIAAWFNSSITVNVNDNTDLDMSSGVVITLESVSPNFEFIGEYTEGQIIEMTMNFRLEGWLYGPTSNSSIIRTINLNYYDLLNPDDILESDQITEEDL